jgi:hypothetical protein
MVWWYEIDVVIDIEKKATMVQRELATIGTHYTATHQADAAASCGQTRLVGSSFLSGRLHEVALFNIQ